MTTHAGSSAGTSSLHKLAILAISFLLAACQAGGNGQHGEGWGGLNSQDFTADETGFYYVQPPQAGDYNVYTAASATAALAHIGKPDDHKLALQALSDRVQDTELHQLITDSPVPTEFVVLELVRALKANPDLLTSHMATLRDLAAAQLPAHANETNEDLRIVYHRLAHEIADFAPQLSRDLQAWDAKHTNTCVSAGPDDTMPAALDFAMRGQLHRCPPDVVSESWPDITKALSNLLEGPQAIDGGMCAMASNASFLFPTDKIVHGRTGNEWVTWILTSFDSSSADAAACGLMLADTAEKQGLHVTASAQLRASLSLIAEHGSQGGRIQLDDTNALAVSLLMGSTPPGFATQLTTDQPRTAAHASMIWMHAERAPSMNALADTHATGPLGLIGFARVASASPEATCDHFRWLESASAPIPEGAPLQVQAILAEQASQCEIDANRDDVLLAAQKALAAGSQDPERFAQTWDALNAMCILGTNPTVPAPARSNAQLFLQQPSIGDGPNEFVWALQSDEVSNIGAHGCK